MNPNKSAFPNGDKTDQGNNNFTVGLTIRDYIAIEAMKGVITDPNTYKEVIGMRRFVDAETSYLVYVAKVAYEYADALITESNKK